MMETSNMGQSILSGMSAIKKKRARKLPTAGTGVPKKPNMKDTYMKMKNSVPTAPTAPVNETMESAKRVGSELMKQAAIQKFKNRGKTTPVQPNKI